MKKVYIDDDAEVIIDVEFINKVGNILRNLSLEEKYSLAFKVAEYFNMINYTAALRFIKFISNIEISVSGSQVSKSLGSRSNYTKKDIDIICIALTESEENNLYFHRVSQ